MMSDFEYQLFGRSVYVGVYQGWKWKFSGKKNYATCTWYTLGPFFLSVGKK